jgi:hypothetical protein
VDAIKKNKAMRAASPLSEAIVDTAPDIGRTRGAEYYRRDRGGDDVK